MTMRPIGGWNSGKRCDLNQLPTCLPTITGIADMTRDKTIPTEAVSSTSETLAGSNLIVFDADCIVCSGFARFMARHDKHAGFRFVTAQSGTGRALYDEHGLDPDLMETNIVIHDGHVYTKMASLAAAMRSLGWPWKAFAVLDLLPQQAADWLYDRIARNRYRFGRRSCPVPSQDLRDRLVD